MNESDLTFQVSSALEGLVGLRTSPGEFAVAPIGLSTGETYVGLRQSGTVDYLALIVCEVTPSGVSSMQFRKLRFQEVLGPSFLMTDGTSFAVSAALIIEVPLSDLQSFCRLASDSIGVLARGGEAAHLVELIRTWADVLGPLSPISESKVLGLWGELVALRQSENVSQMLAGWHVRADSKYDFDLGSGIVLEVKTTVSGKRRHHFSDNQINSSTPIGLQVCSILTMRTDLGQSVNELVESILASLSEPNDVVSFLDRVNRVCRRMSPELDDLKWNLDLAIESMKWFPLSELQRPNYDAPLSDVSWVQEFR